MLPELPLEMHTALPVLETGAQTGQIRHPDAHEPAARYQLPRAPQLGEGVLCILEHLVEPDNVEPALTELDLGQLSFPEARPRVARPVGHDDVGTIDRPAARGRKTDERPGPASNVQQGAAARRQILTELTQLTFEVSLVARVGDAFVWSVIRRSVDRGRQLLKTGRGLWNSRPQDGQCARWSPW